MNPHAIIDESHDRLAGQRWRLDPSASRAEFRVPHFWGVVTIKGCFERLDGWLEVGESREWQIELTIDAGADRFRVEGELEAGGRRVPLELEPTIQQTDHQLDIEVTTTLDQHRLCMTWSPLGMTRTPATHHPRPPAESVM